MKIFIGYKQNREIAESVWKKDREKNVSEFKRIKMIKRQKRDYTREERKGKKKTKLER